MNQNHTFDLIVIGGGPAGYVGAIRAAQLGLNVACVERDQLGGVCLNWGCIPTKALLAGAEFYRKLKHEAERWGISADNIRHDWSKVIGRSRNVAGNLNKGVRFLFKKNKITHFQGQAKITAAGPDCKLRVHDTDGGHTRTLSARNLLLCTGAGPRPFPTGDSVTDFDGRTILSYKHAMALPRQPQSLAIIGAGAIGMEFAYFYNAFGTKVTVIEMLDRLLPNEDSEVSRIIEKAFRKQGIRYHTATRTTAIKITADGVVLTLAPIHDENKTQTIQAEKLLVAIGVMGRYDGLFDDTLGLEIEHHHIKVDRSNFRTNLPNIYAAGDVIGPPWLAHVASEEAVIAVETIAQRHPHPIDYDAIPACTYCVPQVASLGKSEDALKKAGLTINKDYKVGRFPFKASGKAQAAGHTEGFVKIITDAKYHEILGAHMIGDNVTELLAEIGLARKLEATAEELIATMHAHPTLSEAIHEAAMGTQGEMIHA